MTKITKSVSAISEAIRDGFKVTDKSGKYGIYVFGKGRVCIKKLAIFGCYDLSEGIYYGNAERGLAMEIFADGVYAN